MALINIEYGSLAKSDVINSNNIYLDNRITGISNDLDNTNNTLEELSDSFNEFKTSVNEIVTTKICYVSMLPDWSNLVTLGGINLTDYVAPSNGYILLLPQTSQLGTITINNVTVQIKLYSTSADAGSNLITLPVAEGDILTTTVRMVYMYFLPSKTITL